MMFIHSGYILLYPSDFKIDAMLAESTVSAIQRKALIAEPRNFPR